MGERDALGLLVRSLAAPAALRETLLALPTDTPWWRLSASAALQAAGLQDAARTACRDFIMTMGAPSDALRQLREPLAQVAVKLHEFDALRQYIRACYGADVGIALGAEPLHATPNTVSWSLRHGQSVFTFCDRLPTHNFVDIIVKHWALELPLLLGYARDTPGISGTVRLGLADIGARPGLAFSDNRPDYFLIPDPYFIGHEAYVSAREAIEGGALPWSDRRPVAFWRGATTGRLNCAGRECAHWRELPRVALCERTQSGPAASLYDVGLSSVAQLDPVAAAEARNSGLLRDYVPGEHLGRAKYQIDIDGNTNAWTGLFTKLLTGSPVLKVQSSGNFRQWYYDRLKPWWNFIPVRRDMADLTDKLKYLRTHDDLARTIGERGRELAANMTLEGEMIAAHPTITAAFHHSGFVTPRR